MIPLPSDTFQLSALLFELRLQGLLVVLLALTASYRRFSVLESLPGLLVLDWVLQEGVSAILVDDGILQILLLLVGEAAEVN